MLPGDSPHTSDHAAIRSGSIAARRQTLLPLPHHELRLGLSSSNHRIRESPDTMSRREDDDTALGVGNRFVRDVPALPQGSIRSQFTSPFRLPMPYITPGQLAFSAMQFLPVPVLILDGWKTVILANEAMGRLLGMAPSEAEGMVSIIDRLRGQSLSQIGVDLIQDGVPVWVDWEQFLDQVVAEIRAGKTKDIAEHHAEGDATPVPILPANDSGATESNRAENSPSPNSVIEVVISRGGISRTTFDSRVRSNPASFQAQAKMIISLWELSEDQTFFTLTFTNTDSSPIPASAGKKRTVKPNILEADEKRSLAATWSNPPSAASSHDSNSSSFLLSPGAVTLSSTPFPPLGPPSKSSMSNAPSILQKITVMKDTLLDNTQTPILAMWKDGSVTLPNKAARNLFNPNADLDNPLDGFDLLPAWTLWTEDFSRQLDLSEYPITVLIRTETPFTGRRIGMRDSQGKKLVFDVEGVALRDDNTGEFLAGVVTCRDVTKVTEEINRIKAADEERFKLICDTMPQLVWTATPEGAHDFFNGRWYNYTGLSEEDSLGLGWKNPFHPDDMAETEKRWKHSLKTGEPYTTEYRCRSKDGEWRWFLGRALPLRNKQTGEVEKWFGTCTDVHESIETKLEAKRARQQLLSVIALSHMTMFTVDVNHKVTMLEGALIWDSNCDNNGSRWFIGEDVYDVFNRLNSQLPEGQMPPFLKPLEAVLSGKTTDEFQEHEIEGRWYRTRFQPVLDKRGGDKADHVIEGVIGLIIDVTELKSREKDIQAQAREKRQLLANEAAAKEASRLKSQFLANMSHEIRTPITGVIGMAELLLDVELGEEEREITENIYRSGNALLTVINDILDFSKVESGRLDIEEVQFSLSVIVRDVGKMLSFAAERKDLDFQADIASNIESDLVVMGDPGRVRQIITNLLTNSIKFTNQGYVKFLVMKEKETADVTEIKFVIEDSGIGIEDEVRKRLFQPFSQGDASTARKFGGTGLGLTICKNLLDLMNGRMTLKSNFGSGTTATFWIPFNKPHNNQAADLVRIGALPDRLQSEMSVSCNSSEYGQMLGPSSSEQGQFPLNQARSPWRNLSISSSAAGLPEEDLPASERARIQVLVVEDNAINQQIALKTIKKLGFQVAAAWNGKEALEYLVAAEEGTKKKPDIILMDVQMPVIDGYKCTHLLRHHLPYKTYVNNVPIVAMTASAIQGDREKCKRAGMDDYLAKPVKSKILEHMLVRWSRKKRSHTPPPPTRGSGNISDCSEAGEECHNADIPGVGLDDDAITSMLLVEDCSATPDLERNNLDTPRPVKDGIDYFPSADRYTTSPPSLIRPSSAFESEQPIVLGADRLTDEVIMQPIYRVITDELALQSRDDKLMDAAGGGGSAMSAHSITSPFLTTAGEALTEENVGRLEEESSRILASKFP
ncbi:hsp90-like protein [Podospora didyma]|uniref:histidine kinase n=1 Tax=Podospora didyma TaxID=330526 RepID=A0AAE0P7A4_9PEZI|nr:hsp90-like protein [Podospora didyma]